METLSNHILTEDQLEQYLCLICTSVCEKPAKLSCTHMFCLGCLNKLVAIQLKEKDPHLK